LPRRKNYISYDRKEMEDREAECARYKAEIDRPRVEKQPCYLMVVASTVCASRETIEPIQVELSLEGCDFGELEEAREKFFGSRSVCGR